MRWLLVLLLLTLYSSLLTPHSAAADKPIPTSESAKKMTVPPGFNVTLFAGEPDVVQPIAFTFDDRGRMWVVECLSYPKWSKDGKGKDRVICLEDTDGDGKHDKKTVVIDNGVNLSGIEWGFGGIWLCSSPNLLFVPIKDDKPGEPVVMLDGWNMTDTKHNVFNSLIWGPDGYLYGCNGIQSKSWIGVPGTPKEKRTYCDACVWKFHPTKKNFEVVATGTTNPWGLDFDEHGEMFITNCVIDHLFHVVPGGRYQRMFGQDPNPYAFDLMKSAVDYKHWAGGHWTEGRADLKTGALKKNHDDAGGGHAHSGCAIYLGDNFPKEYRNTLFTANIHGSRLNNDGLERTASGMKGVRRPDFLFANDPWFRGICVKQGPEGALYVSDWSDTGECHNYDVADTSNGRIYRVAYGTPKKFAGDVAKMTDAELLKFQESKNEWLVRKGRRVLHERVISGRKLDLPKPLLVIQFDPTKHDDAVLLRHEWLSRIINPHQPGVSNVGKIPLVSRLESARFDDYAIHMAVGDAFARDESPSVRAAALRNSHYLIGTDYLKAVLAALAHPADNADDKLTQLYWLGIQPAVLAKPDEGLSLINKIAIRRVRTNIARLVMILPNTEVAKQLDAVFPTLTAAPNDETRQDILTGILLALEDRKSVTPPVSWAAIYDQLAKSRNETIVDLANNLALKFGDERAMALLIIQATHHKGAEHRGKAIEKLAPLKKPELKIDEMLRGLLVDAEVRGAALRGLAHYPEAENATAILKAYPTFSFDEKADAVLTLASRPKFALALLDTVEKGTIPKGDITAFAARQITALNDKTITEKLGKVWGTVKATNANRAEQTKKLKALLTEDYLKAANIEKGKALYTKSCAACHKLFGEGGDVGPELTGSQRANLDYILENVLDPNAVVPFDYKMVQFNLKDGRVVTGLVKKETAAAFTVRTANEQIIITKDDIEKRTPTNNSVMPEGLFDAFQDEELRDLVAYLQKK